MKKILFFCLIFFSTLFCFADPPGSSEKNNKAPYEEKTHSIKKQKTIKPSTEQEFTEKQNAAFWKLKLLIFFVLLYSLLEIMKGAKKKQKQPQ